MLFVTGDTHGEIGRFGKKFETETGITEGDVVVVCGDFGFLFYPKSTEGYYLQQHELDELETRPYTILFVDGNHENFPLIYSHPTSKKFGGSVHVIRKNVFHLMRGQVYDICGKKVFTMGGAYSRDKYLRSEGISWWSEEMPNNREYREATQNLREVGNSVDIVLTHTAPRDVIRRMGSYPDAHDGELTGFFDYLTDEIKFDKWYFGHWHTDREITEKFTAVYLDTIKVK